MTSILSRDVISDSPSLVVANSNLFVVTPYSVPCRDLEMMLRPQFESFISELVATSNFLAETSYVASSTDQRRDLKLALRPQLLP